MKIKAEEFMMAFKVSQDYNLRISLTGYYFELDYLQSFRKTERMDDFLSKETHFSDMDSSVAPRPAAPAKVKTWSLAAKLHPKLVTREPPEKRISYS